MWSVDLALCLEVSQRYSLPKPIVECGGIANPCIASYGLTVAAMSALRETCVAENREPTTDEVRAAQMCRYIDKHMPLSFLGPYELEDPSEGGLEIEHLAEKHDPSKGTGIGTAILLSVLEHVADPFEAIDRLRDAMAPGGIVIVSVPWSFPDHDGPEDCWRISQAGLRHIFSPPCGSERPPCWQILELGQHVDVPAEAGVLDSEGKAQIVKGVFIVAKAI